MCYGTTLRLPGAFFNPQAIDNLDPIDYVQNLKKLIRNLQGVPPRSNQHQSAIHIPSDLFTQSHIFVHHDATRKPLQAPYDGPYRVISRMKKHFTIDINGRHEVVSLDCLNPAYLDTEFSLLDTMSTHSLPCTGNSNPVTTTHSGRKVHWPETF